jgi:hypothetical protein
MRTQRFLRTVCLSMLTAVVAAGCARTPPRPKVYIQPRMELSRLGALGIVDFASPGRPELGPLTAREFLATLQSAQPGTPVLELGDERQLFEKLGRSGGWTPETLQALAAKYRVDALIVGSLDSQRVSPKVAFDASMFASASAELEGALSAKIVDTRTGATVWSSASRAKAEIAGVQVTDRGISSIGTRDPDDAQQQLVTRLVRKATQDFWGRWE